VDDGKRGESTGSRDHRGGDRGNGRDTGRVWLSPFPSVCCRCRVRHETAARERERQGRNVRETESEIRDAVPCEFWHGSRKLLTLAAFRGKLAEFSM